MNTVSQRILCFLLVCLISQSARSQDLSELQFQLNNLTRSAKTFQIKITTVDTSVCLPKNESEYILKQLGIINTKSFTKQKGDLVINILIDSIMFEYPAYELKESQTERSLPSKPEPRIVAAPKETLTGFNGFSRTPTEIVRRLYYVVTQNYYARFRFNFVVNDISLYTLEIISEKPLTKRFLSASDGAAADPNNNTANKGPSFIESRVSDFQSTLTRNIPELIAATGVTIQEWQKIK